LKFYQREGLVNDILVENIDIIEPTYAGIEFRGFGTKFIPPGEKFEPEMVKDAEANAEADRKFEEIVTARNTLEGLIHATQKTLKEAGDKASADEKSAIETAIKEAEEVVKGDDKGKIDAATTKLTEASSSLAQKMYAEQAAKAQGGGAGGADSGGAHGGGEQAAEDGAVDAEFEEVKEDK